MGLLFNNFEEWKAYCDENKLKLFEPVLSYETEQKSRDEKAFGIICRRPMM